MTNRAKCHASLCAPQAQTLAFRTKADATVKVPGQCPSLPASNTLRFQGFVVECLSLSLCVPASTAERLLTVSGHKSAPAVERQRKPRRTRSKNCKSRGSSRTTVTILSAHLVLQLNVTCGLWPEMLRVHRPGRQTCLLTKSGTRSVLEVCQLLTLPRSPEHAAVSTHCRTGSDPPRALLSTQGRLILLER